MEILILILLSISMFLGAMIGGYIPLMLNLSPSKLRLITTFGAGLLIGCVLIVIIPEGIETLSKANEPVNTTMIEEMVKQNDTLKVKELIESSKSAFDHKIIGLSLVLGFSLMFLVDHYMGSHSHSPVSQEIENQVEHIHSNSISAVLGLLIHSAADGLALGAATVSEQPSIGLVIFFAIMLHKAPAAFGLTSLLINKGEKKSTIIKQLLLFSSAAPVMALITHGILSIFQWQDYLLLQWFSGVLLLFSAGTFLFVATQHSFPKDEDMNVWDVLTLLGGMVLPLLLPLDE